MEHSLIGREVVSVRGEDIGKISALYIHGDGDEPNWALVRTGLFGMGGALVPLHDAVSQEDGCICVVYEKEHVKDAPEIELEGDTISDEDADLLHRHYGLERVTGLTAPGGDDEIDIDLPRETRDAKPPGMDEGEDNPLTKRRLERARELGVPSAQEAAAEAS